MTAALPLITILNLASSVLYPGATGSITGPGLPSIMAGVKRCELHFADGVRASGSLLGVEENGWLLLVLGYTTAQGREVKAKGWALEQPEGQAGEQFRIRSMIPAGPVSVT
jgi:hypothetical protein